MTTRTLAAAVLVAILGTAMAQQPKPNDPVPLPAPKAALKADKPDIAKQLAARVTLNKFDGKFKDAVNMLADKYNLTLVVDPRLGQEPQGVACEAPADDKNVTLPKLANVRLDTVLNLLAEQVNGKFLVYPDYIKIVPEAFAYYETGILPTNPNPNDDSETQLLPIPDILRNKPLIKRGLVNASFKNQPLSEVLDEIAESTGATIAVSPLLPVNMRQATITVRFANTPVEAAVRTLCEMTECGVIEDANVLVVTTRERAAARAKELADKLKAKQTPAVGFGGGGLGGLSVPDQTAAELAKLKEQNEQLKKQLDEIQKLLKK